MIRHVLEVWLLLLGAFIIGGVLGTFAYVLVAATPLAGPQEWLAATVGRGIDGIRRLFGLAPMWGPDAYARPASRYYDREFHSYNVPVQRDRRPQEAGDEGRIASEADSAAPMADGAAAEVIDKAWTPTESEAEWDGDSGWDEPGSTENAALQSIEPDYEEAALAEAAVEEPELPSMQPVGLSYPRNGVPDDLQRIRGIGKKNEEVLNSFGVFHFGQIAAWTPAEVRWMAQHLSFPERIERDDWIGQATILATGGDTGYVKASARGPAHDVEEPSGEDFSEER